MKRRKRIFLVSVFIFLFFSIFCAATYSSETTHSPVESTVNEENSGHPVDRSGDLRDLLYRFINFALMVIILFLVVRRTSLRDFFKNRSDDIRKKLETLEREKEEAETRYRDMEKQLRDFEDIKQEIIGQYRNEGLAEKEKIIAEAKHKIEDIIKQSELTIQQEIQSAKSRLRWEVMEVAAQKAGEILSREITEGDQDKLINEFIEGLGKIH
ncbi:MAG: ATP synthase F0 subunit B [Deltaproteobacteria bacterium]|nr:ATP synthase F0 subunit B [Deltaproteobacteria bacterium]